MKKLLRTVLVLVAVFCMLPAFSCPSATTGSTGNVSGAACSIKELNNLEKSKNTQEKAVSTPKGEKDLRPVNTTPEIRNSSNEGCLIGDCLYKTLLGR